MQIDNFKVDISSLHDELNQLSDTMKYLLYENDNTVFDSFDFEKEYLEPALFYYFFKKTEDEKSSDYQQYIIDKYSDSSPISFDISLDCFKNCNIPGKGYIQNPKQKRITFDNGQYSVGKEALDIKKDKLIKDSKIKVCSTVPNILHQYHPADFEHSIIEIRDNVISDLDIAYSNLSKYSPEFSRLLNIATKEISVYNLPKTPSFASINYFGTSFINIFERKYNEVFFMDEIAHQSGHSIFTLLTRDTQSYFLHEPQTLLKNFTGFSGEGRTLYGSFHSMFTLCTIIHTLYAFLKNGSPKDDMKVELYGRIGFYLDKLIYDIDIISKIEIYTPKGQQIYQMFAENMSDYCKLENGIFLKFNYDNQHYLFSTDLFLDLNKSILDEANIS